MNQWASSKTGLTRSLVFYWLGFSFTIVCTSQNGTIFIRKPIAWRNFHYIQFPRVNRSLPLSPARSSICKFKWDRTFLMSFLIWYRASTGRNIVFQHHHQPTSNLTFADVNVMLDSFSHQNAPCKHIAWKNKKIPWVNECGNVFSGQSGFLQCFVP